ncbi:CoA transferase [Streptomyces monashensis]|uniref:CoA transferase n=1 Tax=Streptomyces monashensis TaxID=1678012 RepID=A0A1S2QHW3_9ACTN|nr:CoA transferase [Streptomyces monashensis]OIK05237.1 hypothetical protein BIV23_13315 [Streptomyces monashensis]
MLDLTHVIAGPVAARLLAQFGVEVLHLSRPGRTPLAALSTTDTDFGPLTEPATPFAYSGRQVPQPGRRSRSGPLCSGGAEPGEATAYGGEALTDDERTAALRTLERLEQNLVRAAAGTEGTDRAEGAAGACGEGQGPDGIERAHRDG